MDPASPAAPATLGSPLAVFPLRPSSLSPLSPPCGFHLPVVTSTCSMLLGSTLPGPFPSSSAQTPPSCNLYSPSSSTSWLLVDSVVRRLPVLTVGGNGVGEGSVGEKLGNVERGKGGGGLVSRTMRWINDVAVKDVWLLAVSWCLLVLYVVISASATTNHNYNNIMSSSSASSRASRHSNNLTPSDIVFFARHLSTSGSDFAPLFNMSTTGTLLAGILLTAFGSSIMAFGSTLMKLGLHLEAQKQQQPVTYPCWEPTWWSGFGGYGLGAAFHVIALAFAPASVLAPMNSIGLIANAVAAATILREQFGWIEGISTAGTVVGVTLCAIASFLPHSDTPVRTLHTSQAIHNTRSVYHCALYAPSNHE
eukprot:GHVQ01042529.1.p1 GENE.GHVQ01042529.1~~GHVQ01042529.1.p1  ORF type:complete len:365 (-),score=57.08 GHVQ01042529.1:15-1109(-)